MEKASVPIAVLLLLLLLLGRDKNSSCWALLGRGSRDAVRPPLCGDDADRNADCNCWQSWSSSCSSALPTSSWNYSNNNNNNIYG